MRFSSFVNSLLIEERNLGDTIDGLFAIAIAVYMAYGRIDTKMIQSIRKSMNLRDGKVKCIIDNNIANDNAHLVKDNEFDKISVYVEINLRNNKVDGMFGKEMVADPEVDSNIAILVNKIPKLKVMKKIHDLVAEILTKYKKDEIIFTVVADGVTGSSSRNNVKGDVRFKISASSKTDILKDLCEPIVFSLKNPANSSNSIVLNMSIFTGLFCLGKLFQLKFMEGLEGIKDFPDNYWKMQEIIYQHPDKIPDEDHFIHYVKKYLNIQDRYHSGVSGETDFNKNIYQAKEELDHLNATIKRFIKAISEEIQTKNSEVFTVDPRARVFTVKCLEFLRKQIFSDDMSRVISIKQNDIQEIEDADFDKFKDEYVINLQTDEKGNMRFYGIDINNERKLLFQIRPRLEYNIKSGKKIQTLMVEVGNLQILSQESPIPSVDELRY